ncbi:hypothetical protein TNCV_4374251 [Trichonephila clavipes]|uniref:Uncharacterized protein n=1 Tax=Trichonephila clavipes TaxID=2585209 RepID=A0A8X6RCP8_TRICX|nr:hypothetical protein TNCV_4374251 [Trichonephila clavipes]
MRTSAIKDLLKKWADVRAMVLEWHPNQADVSRKHLGGEQLADNDEVLHEDLLWMPYKPKEFYATGIEALTKRWNK